MVLILTTAAYKNKHREKKEGKVREKTEKRKKKKKKRKNREACFANSLKAANVTSLADIASCNYREGQ